jgi:DNA-directed RNA polymerase subunit RPC12/RpoP/phage FluMu protein Com
MVKIPKLILSKPKLVVDIKCPKCKSMDILALPIVETTCKNCKTRFQANVNINILAATAKKYVQMKSHNNEIWILGERNDSLVFHSDDALRPRDSNEDAIYHTILAYKKLAELERCYEVSEITNEYDDDYRVFCKTCGVCYNCVTCIKCGQKYVPTKIETKHGSEKKYKCTKCGFRNYKQTFIPKTDDKCPYCGSSNFKKTRFNTDNKKCPKCHSKNTSIPRKVPVYKLIIKRQKRNEIKQSEN